MTQPFEPEDQEDVSPWAEDENPEALAGKELTDEELAETFEEEEAE